jgi:hypothetical protein
MSEQPGKAAGTAEPTESPEPLNFNKPWVRSTNWPGVILNRDGVVLAQALSTRCAEDAEAIAKHIVACVNFCSNLAPELVEALSGGDYQITCKRVDPVLAAELANNSKQFHADQADKPAVVMTAGGVI